MIFENYQKNLFAVRLNLAKFSKIKPYFFRSFDDGTQSVPAQDDGVANCTSFRDLLFIKSLITHLFAPSGFPESVYHFWGGYATKRNSHSVGELVAT